MVSQVKQRILNAVESGKQQATEAFELIEIGKRAGIDLNKEETQLEQQTQKILEIERAVLDKEAEKTETTKG